ncbi:ComEC/Rec2 family competence protein [Robertkochia sediminum]|uniref:ComEC/Rec2 family competence protein n=1 Tax=Robertkochia sediminum TaxID=2785326 RepID=UPI001932EBD4|nr:ComEC/Rec2 family competence protein [Robertkochia sediminum]MBL7472993.1 ComEC/Rec2 family competence protein [Robertkochia sediminum]
MKLLNVAIFKLLIYLIIGILLGYHFPEELSEDTVHYILITLGCFLGLSIIYNSRKLFELFCFLLFVGVGYTSAQHPASDTHRVLQHTSNSHYLLEFKVTASMNKSRSHYRYRGMARLPGAPQFSEQIIVRTDTLQPNTLALLPGATYRAVVTTTRINGPAQPGAFDYKAYLRTRNICAVVDIAPKTLTRISPPKGLLYASYKRTTHIQDSLKNSGLDAFTSGLLQALVLGNRDNLDMDFYEDLRIAGGAHLVALSGLHIGIFTSILGFLLWPLRRLPKGSWIHFTAIVILLFTYVSLTGASSSVVRAAVMFCFLVYSVLIQRRASSLNTLILSAFILLLFDAWHLFEAGFQLSYAAVTGILLIYRPALRFWRPRNAIIRWAWSLCTVSIGAQIFTAPLVIYYFGQLPGAFLLTNLLITPLITLALALGYLIVTLVMITELPQWMAFTIGQGGQFLRTITENISLPDLLIRDLPELHITEMLLLYALIFSATLCLYRPTHLRTTLALIAILQLGYVLLPDKNPGSHIYICHDYGNTVLLKINGKEKDQLNSGSRPPLPHILQLGNKHLLILDRIPVHKLPPLPEHTAVLLINSAPINLDRLIDTLQPAVVIADGSNYPNVVARWRATCEQKNIPFHHTGEKGYYVLNEQ